MKHDSMAPKTRPITDSGATRWTMVSKLTSTSGLPSPRRAIATKHAAGVGQIATSASGSDHSRMPTAMSLPIRPREAREIASTPPASAPTPSTESRKPTPRAPIPRISSAITSTKTAEPPATIVCAAVPKVIRRSPRLCAISRNPAAISRR